MKKYIFLDFDGTLVGKSKKITDNTVHYLNELINEGHKVFLVTGRAPTTIPEEANRIHYNGIVSSAGGFISINDNYIFEGDLGKDIIEKTKAIFENAKASYMLETNHGVYYSTSYKDLFLKHSFSAYPNFLDSYHPLSTMKKNCSIPKICFISEHVHQEFKNSIELLEQDYHIVIYKETKDYIHGELINKKCTKADAIKYIMNYYHEDMSNTYAFGDSMNDYQMIETVHVGVVSQSSPQQLIDISDYTFEDPDQDGIYKILKELI